MVYIHINPARSAGPMARRLTTMYATLVAADLIKRLQVRSLRRSFGLLSAQPKDVLVVHMNSIMLQFIVAGATKIERIIDGSVCGSWRGLASASFLSTITTSD